MTDLTYRYKLMNETRLLLRSRFYYNMTYKKLYLLLICQRKKAAIAFLMRNFSLFEEYGGSITIEIEEDMEAVEGSNGNKDGD